MVVTGSVILGVGSFGRRFSSVVTSDPEPMEWVE